jgi:hypothetical protein
MDTSDLRSAAAKASDNPAVENAARLGYAVSGVLHLLIGWLGIQLAWFGGDQSADQSGALQQLASTPVGRIVLWLAVVGFLGLGLWQLTELILGRGGGSGRAKAAGKGVVYLVLAFTSFTWARTEGGKSSSEQSVDFTASLIDKPAGRILVGAVGLAVIGVGAYHVYKGWAKRFLKDLRQRPSEWVVRAGRFGYIAKGVALALVGFLFLLAAIHGAAQEATGLDGALRKLLQAPFGQWLLTLVALGFASYAIYSFARARYARV